MMFLSKSAQGYASLVSNKVYNFLDCKYLNLGFLMLFSWVFFKAILLLIKKKLLGFLLKLYCEQDSLTDLNYIVKPEEYLIRIMFPDE